MKRIAVVFLLIFLEIPAGFAAESVSGTWTGTVSQSGYGSYEVIMTLDSETGGSIEYPSLNCGGTLSGGGSGGVYDFYETITYGEVTPGKEGCISGGAIHLVLQGDGLFWEWRGSYESESYYASGKLYRTGGGNVKSCEECGEALLNDVAYGLDPSQNLRNYVLEARQNYSNCMAGIADACIHTCGRQLYDNLPGCDTYDDAGHRACAETAHRGARLSCPQ